jgi:sortase A
VTEIPLEYRRKGGGGKRRPPRKKTGSGLSTLLLLVTSLVLALGGGGLILALFLVGIPASSGQISDPVGGPLAANAAPSAPEARAEGEAPLAAPRDTMLRLSVPEMSRARDGVPVPTADGTDEEALKGNLAIHVKGTGFPWQEGANVYVAGHRLGYAGTPSFLGFYDLDKLDKGDEVKLTDADGRRYAYRVTETFEVGPKDAWITRPVEGKDLLTLQTCTLPDFSRRLIVRAEKVES